VGCSRDSRVGDYRSRWGVRQTRVRLGLGRFRTSVCFWDRVSGGRGWAAVGLDAQANVLPGTWQSCLAWVPCDVDVADAA